jgi:hypothetical protein
MPHFDLSRRYRPYGSRLVRFNFGLEAIDGLLADLERDSTILRAWAFLLAYS